MNPFEDVTPKERPKREKAPERPTQQDFRDRDEKLESSYDCPGKPYEQSMPAFISQNKMDYAELFMSYLANSTKERRVAFYEWQVKTFGRELEYSCKGMLLAEIRRLQGDPRYANAQHEFKDPVEYSKWLRAVDAAGGKPKPGQYIEFTEAVCAEAGVKTGDGPHPMPGKDSVQV